MSGSTGGNVWPATMGIGLLFAQGCFIRLHYHRFRCVSACRGGDHRCTRSVPWGIVRSVFVSGVAGWILLGAVVLAAPSVSEAAAQGEGAFLSILNNVLPWPLCAALIAAIILAQYLLWIGNRDVSIADGVRVCSRRGTALFASSALGLSEAELTTVCDLGVVVTSVLFTVFTPVYAMITAVCTIFLYISYVVPCAGSLGVWQNLDDDGPVGPGARYRPLAILSTVGMRGLDRRRDAVAERAISLDCGRVCNRASSGMVLLCASLFFGPADYHDQQERTSVVIDAA